MAPDIDPVTAWARLLRVHAAVVPKLAKELAAVGLPISWYDVLLVLNAAPDRRLRMTELGEQAVLSREQISRVVTELQRAGLVDRAPNPDDKRSWFATITPAGRARLREAAPSPGPSRRCWPPRSPGAGRPADRQGRQGSCTLAG
jgi:DNA-binding MarR family transcriptional regulator